MQTVKDALLTHFCNGLGGGDDATEWPMEYKRLREAERKADALKQTLSASLPEDAQSTLEEYHDTAVTMALYSQDIAYLRGLIDGAALQRLLNPGISTK